MWRDVHLWLVLVPSLVAGALVAGIVMLVTGVPSSVAGWIAVGAVGVVVVLVAFVTLAMGVNSARAFARGAAESDERRAQSFEASGRAAGAMVGRGLRGLRRGSRRPPTARPAIDVASTEQPAPPAPDAGAASPPSGGAAPPAPHPGSASAERGEEPPAVTVDAAARSIGSMVGRRLADRRRRG